jgi:hypothetical protein
MTSACFCTPSLGHSVSLEYLKAHTETIVSCLRANIGMNWITRGGDQFVAKVRSKLVEEFLATDAENLFFLDDDIGWPAEKVVEFLNRPEPIIAGVYPKKQDTQDWPVSLVGEGGQLHERDGLVQAAMIPMGFTKIHRSVLEALAVQLDAAPEGAPVRFREVEADGQERTYRGFFNAGIGPDGLWWGEDHAFCQNVMGLGYEVWVDPDIEFTHRGQKKWMGTLAPSLETFRERALALAETDNKEAA